MDMEYLSRSIGKKKEENRKELCGKSVLAESVVTQSAIQYWEKASPVTREGHCLNLLLYFQRVMNSLHQWWVLSVRANASPAYSQLQSLNININFPFLRRSQAV